MNNEVSNDRSRIDTKMLHVPRPSSPRKFFARLYGHLEEPKTNSVSVIESVHCGSESSSDVEVERDSEDRNERVSSDPVNVPLWHPPPLPICPRPMILPHQQLAFGAGLAAFRKLLQVYLFKC